MSTIGSNIRSRRLELNMTQEELASKLGYKSKSTINKIELGTNDIPQSKIVQFANALDTTPSFLMGWEEQIKTDAVGIAELHFEMITDEAFVELFADYKKLDNTQKKIVADLVHNLAGTKKEA